MFRCEIEHTEVAITAAQQVHRFQPRVGVLPGALQFRQCFARPSGVDQSFTQLEAKLEIGWVTLGTLPRFLDRQLGPLFLRLDERFRSSPVIGRAGIVFRQKFFVGRDLIVRLFPPQIGCFANEVRIGPLR